MRAIIHNKKQDFKEAFHDLSYRISNYANQDSTRIDFLKRISKLLIDFSGCDEIEFWLADFDKQKRYELIKQSGKSFQFEIRDSIPNNKNGEPMTGAEHNLNITKLYQNIINGEIDLSSSSLFKRSSSGHGDLNNYIFNSGDTRNKIKKFNSIIIVPLMSGDKIIGLLQLKGRRKNFFSHTEMEFYENFAQTLGILLLNQRSQAALRERVKELTCMYGIEQAASAGVSIDEIMQSAVELLPPAWQYPKIARGKIVLDGRVYVTSGFKNRPDRLIANIVVNGEKRGEIEVVYTKAAFSFDEGPFLREERHLIDNIARALALIIEQKQTEEEKARLKEQIRHADRLATIGQLAAGIAHELNEPLGAILGYAQLMKKNPLSSGQMKKDVGKIVKASLHAREIVRKLLIFARQMPTKKVRIDLNQIVNDGLYFLESRCAQEGIKVIRLLEENLPAIIADPSQMTQVLVNLIVNAVQAMKEGGTLTVRTMAHAGHIYLVIEDTGEGMSDEVIKQIFLPFFTTKEIGQGTGLGLAVVHGIIISHGGAISVKSTPGRGSTFKVCLPCTNPVQLQ